MTITLTPTSTPNFYDVLSSNLWDHYPLLVEADRPDLRLQGFHPITAIAITPWKPRKSSLPTIPEPTTAAIPVEGTDGQRSNLLLLRCLDDGVGL
jgi:hypothetical protein